MNKINGLIVGKGGFLRTSQMFPFLRLLVDIPRQPSKTHLTQLRFFLIQVNYIKCSNV